MPTKVGTGAGRSGTGSTVGRGAVTNRCGPRKELSTIMRLAGFSKGEDEADRLIPRPLPLSTRGGGRDGDGVRRLRASEEAEMDL